jgi:hypothetical protein
MAKNPCKYLIEIAKGEFKEFTEPELKDYLLSQDLSKLKSIQNAIQERAAEEKVSRPTGAGKNIPEGGEGVRPSKQRTKITEKGGVEGYEKVNDFLYKGSDKSKKMSLLKRLMDADIPQSYKDALSKKGLDYKVSNQVEASNVAKSMVNELGVYDALDVARNNMVDPSVGSAIFGKAIDKIYLDEITLRSQGRIEEADILAQQWADTSIEYAKISNSGGKWNAQIAYFYKTSPMGFVMRVNNERAEQFKEWFANKEEGYKEVFDDIIKSEEGQKLLLEEVEGLRKSERQVERKKRDKSIDDFFEKAKLKTNVSYATVIPPQVWNGAMDVMKVSVKAGDRVVVSIQRAIEYIDKNLGGKEWDKDRFKKDYEAQLSKITEEKADVDVLGNKIKGLEKQIEDYKKRISEGGALKQKPSEKFADNEEVQRLKKERESLQKENQNLLKQKKEGRYSDEARISQSEKRILKNIDELEKKIEDNDLEIEKPEKLTTPRLEELKSQQKKLREELETRRKLAGVGRFSEDAKYEAKAERNKKRIAELNRRMEQGDFSSEAYKAKKEKDQLDIELEAVREQYNEAKKKSPEYIDRQAKQYLDKFRSKLKGLNQDQQEAIVKKSIKKLAESGALEYDDFKTIISETLGIKNLTPEQIQRIEKLTKETNISDDVEQAFLDAPSRETIDAYKIAKQKSLESDKELFELTYNNADVTGTLKSILTLNLMGAGTVIKNYGSNILYQGTIRFPKSLIAIGIDKTIYGSTLMLNKFVGTKVIKQQLSLTDAQLGYFKEYNEGLVKGMDQMIKGVDEKDYFGSSQYASRLNPKKSLEDIKAALKGEIFLTNAQKWDKGIQATLGWQPYAVSRLMIYGDKPPRYAAQGAMALQIGHNELGITNPLEMEAFMLSPEKYAYNILMKTGEIKGKAGAFEKMTSDEATKISKDINDRIIQAGAVATFQNENYASIINNFIDKSLAVTKESPMVVKLVSPPIALLKATQLPFVKTPANIIWAYVKLANPAFTAAKALGEVSYAQYLKSKGNKVEARKYGNKSKDSMATTILGMAISAAAISFASQGLVRTKSSEKDTERETAGEAFFGKDNELNIGKMLGTDDFWVDLSWFPGIGAILDTQARIIEDNKAKALKGEKVEEYPFGYDILGTLGYSFSSSLNTLVLDQGARVVNAIRSGEKAAENWSMNTLNTVSNAFTGGTFSTLSRALLPEKPSTKADNMWERIQNEQKTRNAVIRFFAGRPPSKISIWGEPIANNNSIIGSFLGYEAGSNNKFGAILYDDAQRTGNDKFFPAPEDYKIKVNGKDQKLTEEQKMKLDMYIGQARKNIASPYIYDMGRLPEYEAKYSDLSDQDKLDVLDVIYTMGKDAGFAKFKEEYKQFQDAEINVEEIIKKAEQSAKKTLFKVSLMDNQ